MNKTKWESNKNISHHHGTCDMCGRKHVVIIMFGYIKQDPCYSICKNCLADNIVQIVFGFDNYTDGLISLRKNG
jgi:ribosomal protein S14